MGWERGQYDTRSRKVGGKVVREYVGAGPAANLVAQADADLRTRRDAERAAEDCARARLAKHDGPLAALNAVADLLARAALLAAGHHQHHRSEWRRRRECDTAD